MNFCHVDRDYEPTVERMWGPRGFFPCWSNTTCSTSARNIMLSFQEIRARRWEKARAKCWSNNKILEHNAIISRDFEPDVVRRSGPMWFFVILAEHHMFIQQVLETQCNQQVIETQCNHLRDYEPTIERTSGPRELFHVGRTSHVLNASQMLREGQCQRCFLCWSNIACNTFPEHNSIIWRDFEFDRRCC